jgi:hypothetical protein
MTKGLAMGSMIAVGLISVLLVSACGSNSTSSDCGNSVVNSGETCDTAIASGGTGACPTSCNDNNACTTDNLENAGTCTAKCTYTAITPCCGNNQLETGEECDPPNGTTCSPTCKTISQLCGNGTLDAGENCDKGILADQPNACPASCDDGNTCTTDTLEGYAADCSAKCTNTAITPCCGNLIKETGEDCDPPNGTNCGTDCKTLTTCGNGQLDTGETCDTAIISGTGACPTSCTAPDACTTSQLQNAGTCIAACQNTAIIPCCGNSAVETGEDCEPPGTSTCDSNCQSIEVDITGTWISHFNTTGTITSPAGNVTGATIDIIFRLYISNSGGNAVSKFEICSLQTTKPNSFSVTYSNAVMATLNTTANGPEILAPIGDTITMPTFNILTGTQLATFPTDSNSPCSAPPLGCPTNNCTATCSDAPNTDGDSMYGVALTINIPSYPAIAAYTGIYITTALNDAVLQDATTITGTTSFMVDGYVWGTAIYNITVLNYPGPFGVTPDSAAVGFTALKLTGNQPCSTVLTKCSTGPTGSCHL